MSKKDSISKEVIWKIGGISIGLALIFSYKFFMPKKAAAPTPAKASAPAAPTKGLAPIKDALKNQTSGITVEHFGTVTELLPDADWSGMHQRFQLKLDDDFTLMIAHNIGIAPRAEVNVGDRVEFKGRYEWNSQGGVVHMTHHDPDMKAEDGWLKVNGKPYR